MYKNCNTALSYLQSQGTDAPLSVVNNSLRSSRQLSCNNIMSHCIVSNSNRNASKRASLKMEVTFLLQTSSWILSSIFGDALAPSGSFPPALASLLISMASSSPRASVGQSHAEASFRNLLKCKQIQSCISHE